MRRLAIAGLVALSVACTSQEDMALLHREITDVQRQVQQLQGSTLDKRDLAAMESRMQELTGKTMKSSADLTVRVERLQEQIEALVASLELTTRKLQVISEQLAAVRAQGSDRPMLPPVVAAPDAANAGPSETGPNDTGDRSTPPGSGAAGGAAAGPSAAAASTPESLYRSAYEDYMRGNYDLAAEGFREYLRRWGGTDLADNAQYWIGECYDAEERSQEALDAFSEVLEKYPTSDKAAAAQLKKGLIYLKLGDQGQAVVNLQYVVYEHPGTKEADLARERLRSLGLTIR